MNFVPRNETKGKKSKNQKEEEKIIPGEEYLPLDFLE
jgi:hypothetical protein